MNAIHSFRNAYVEGRIEMKNQMKEVFINYLCVLAGVLFRFSWGPLWRWMTTGIWNFDKAIVIVPTLLISFGASTIVLASTWKLLENTDREVRWAVAFASGAGASWVLREPAATTFTALGVLPPYPTMP